VEVVLYQFDDGWQVRRVLDLKVAKALTGQSHDGRGYALFALYDSGGGARSLVGARHYHGIGSFGLHRRISIMSAKHLVVPAYLLVAPYWRSFIEEAIGKEYLHGVLPVVGAYPDELLERLQISEVERQIEVLEEAAHHETGSTNFDEWSKAEALVDDLRKRTVIEVFSDLPGIVFPEYSACRRSSSALHEDRSHRRSGYGGKKVAIKLVDSNLFFSISGGHAGWSVEYHSPEGRDGQVWEMNTLFELWEAFVSSVGEVMRILLVPESEFDNWWASNTMPGELLFDLEAYFLLDTDSPFVLPDVEFKAWAEQMKI